MKLIRKKSKFNNIIILNTATWGKALILNGELQSTERDQEIYHRALCFNAIQPAAKHILILGGGEGATAKLILDSDPHKQVVMVEIDKEVVNACCEHIPSMSGDVWQNPNLTLIYDDAYSFVDQCAEKMDVIISDLSTPELGGISEPLFQKEFYAKVKNLLRPKGIFIMQATHRPHLYWDDFKKVFADAKSWSEWVPSFGVPWHFFGGTNAVNLTLLK